MSRVPNIKVPSKRPYWLLVCPALTFGLGTWQIQRRKWKLNLLDNLEKQMKAEPRLVDSTHAMSQYFEEYQPLKFRGHYDFSKQLFIGPRSLLADNIDAGERRKYKLSGTGGYLVLTPFQLEDGNRRIIVNRGWIPREMKKEQETKTSESSQSETVEIVGLFRNSESKQAFMPDYDDKQNVMCVRDISLISQIMNTDDIYVDLRYDSVKQKDDPIAGQTRVNIRNEHAQYIATWYTLTALMLFVWFRRYWK